MSAGGDAVAASTPTVVDVWAQPTLRGPSITACSRDARRSTTTSRGRSSTSWCAASGKSTEGGAQCNGCWSNGEPR